jgi:hypothetical protein
VTGDERKKWLDKWMLEVDKIGKGAPIVTHRDRSHEWLRNRPPQMEEVEYAPPTEEQLAARELHIQWARENYDPITAKPLPTWIPENEWLKNQKKRK